jgi:hypothetical protein
VLRRDGPACSARRLRAFSILLRRCDFDAYLLLATLGPLGAIGCLEAAAYALRRQATI